MKTKHYIALILALALTAATPTQGQSHHDSAEEWQRHHAQQLEQQRQRLQLEQQRRDLQRLQDARSRADAPDRFTPPSQQAAPGSSLTAVQRAQRARMFDEIMASPTLSHAAKMRLTRLLLPTK
jgi:hypothetical protein